MGCVVLWLQSRLFDKRKEGGAIAFFREALPSKPLFFDVILIHFPRFLKVWALILEGLGLHFERILGIWGALAPLG